ncbi:hypothetical protein [Pseudobacteroides cellulosolvens]|nr:hypothetical protein [Pseudobacteroides cellulosolvens]
MLSDCEKCVNKNTEAWRTCSETSGGKPSMYKEIVDEKCDCLNKIL